MSYLYGLVYALGFVFGALCLYKAINNKIRALNYALSIAIGAILGGRLGYVIFYEPLYYLNYPLEIIEIYKGGMSYHGGLIGLILSLYYISYDKAEFFNLADRLVTVSLVIIPLGRIVNFLNGELWGTISYMPWAVIFEGADNNPRHPVQLYEAIAEGPLLYLFIKIILYILSLRHLYLPYGTKASLYLVGYGLLRTLTEFFRESDVMVGRFFNFLNLGQILCFLMIALGCCLFYQRLKMAVKIL